jgi:ABC-type transport system involved in multi-copper enzyme maturation permease subunit
VNYRLPSLVSAELYRVSRQRSNWLLPLVPLAGLAVLAMLTATSYGLTDLEGKTVLTAERDLSDTAALVVAMTLGIPVLLLAARVAAHDYAYGTARLLLGGGAGRCRLLLAKLAATALLATAGLLVSIVVAGGAVLLLSPAVRDNLGALPPTYWHEAMLDIFAVSVSIAGCALLGTATSTVSRSLTAGLTAAMVWFPTENILVGLLAFAVATTHSDLFVDVSGWLLAPNLNHLIQALEPWRSAIEMAARPLGETRTNPVGPVGAEQCLLVIAAWATAFVIASFASVLARIDLRT